jgi:hypothetical protein
MEGILEFYSNKSLFLCAIINDTSVTKQLCCSNTLYTRNPEVLGFNLSRNSSRPA